MVRFAYSRQGAPSGNPFDFLVAVQRNHALAEESPEEWMPWSYQATLKGLEAQ